MNDRLLDEYSHIARTWGWDAHIKQPRRRWFRGRIRWILILASIQAGLCLGSSFTIRTLESSARLKHRMEVMLK